MTAASSRRTFPFMTYAIRELDPADDATMRRYHEICWRAEKEDGRDWTSMWTLPEMTSSFRAEDDGEDLVGLCAFDGEEMVGSAFAAYPLKDNVKSVYLQVFVEPERRRRGIGSALLEALVEHARQRGRSELEGEATYRFEEREDGPMLRFAARHGFRVANMEIQRVLPLPVPTELLETIAAESEPHHTDYTIETYVGLVPEALQASYCDLSNQLILEAPAGEFEWEAETMTPEAYRARWQRQADAGRQRYSTVAVRDGEVVALTDLVLSEGSTRVQQWYTLVRRGHRGHRLGNAVKVANLARMQAEHPERVDVTTTNAETNEQMVGINERLGFEAVACCPGFLRRL